jgi:alkaline phosphatase D
MRIAFASCMFSERYPAQPVWAWIAAQQPDRVVLLGDSTYFDIDTPLSVHPRDMDDWSFAQHVFQRYVALIAQPQLAALVQGMPPNSVEAIWDDHDFLWDGATGGDRGTRTVHGGKIRLATAFLEAFRAALRQQFAPGSFPSTPNDAAFWNMQQPALTTPSLPLAPGLWLHLSDGRSHRTQTTFVAESKRTTGPG